MISRRSVISWVVRLAGAVSATAVAACGNGGASGGEKGQAGGQAASGASAKTPASITWLAWAGAGPETEQYQLNADEFMKQQPHIKVEWVNGGNVDGNLEKFLTMAAGGTPPNIVQVHYSNCVDLASRGTLASLDSFMARDRVRKEDYVPGLIDEFAWKKVQYGLPKDNALRVMFYNLDLFDKAGVKYPAENWTWDDFLEIAKKLTNRTLASGTPTFGVADFFLNINDSPSYTTTRCFDGEWFNPTWTASTIDMAPTVEAIQFTADWRNRYKISPAPGEIQGGGDAFRRGHVAMGIAFAQQVFFLKEEKVTFRYDVVPLPRGKAGAFPCATGSGQSMAKNATTPDASWQFLKYLTGPEAQKRITSLKRWGSSRVDTLEAILPADGIPKNFKAAFIEPLQGKTKDKPVAIPTPPRAKDLEAIYKKEFAAVQRGEKTAKDAAVSVKPQLDEIMKTAGGR
ncbi:MAG: sugar ABC transporter substrate-binding protein [Chloroflexi bacterium]|nr:sugar ABC transporter substrate-binding protein [Chloroflexota bacterium]